jgi:transcriptional regulator with XRE-family HTH domain
VSTTATATSGFPGQLRRWRTARRVSQLELALRAGTTQRHVSYIEQGRSRPGRTMVVRLAESLELPLRERNALLLAAGFAPAFPESRMDAEALGPIRAALEQVLVGHLPYPALIAGPSGDLVAANAAVELLAEGADDELLRPPLNVLRLALHPRGLAPRVVNLAEWGRHVVFNVRASAVRRGDRGLEALGEELAGYVPPLEPGPEHVGFTVPLRLRQGEAELRLITTLTHFATAPDVTLDELHLEAFLPADAQTAQLLAQPPARRARLPAELVVGAGVSAGRTNG